MLDVEVPADAPAPLPGTDPEAVFVSRPADDGEPLAHPDVLIREAERPGLLAVAGEHIVRFFEYYLIVACVSVMTAVSALVLLGGSAGVTAMATGIGVLSLQTAIQAVDRHRQRHLRARALHEIREMLRDRVLNELAAIKMMSDGVDPRLDRRFAAINGTIDEVADLINSLSEEQLDTWKMTYARSAKHIAMPKGGDAWSGLSSESAGQ